MTAVIISIKCEGEGCSDQAHYLARVHQVNGCQEPECVDGTHAFTLCGQCVRYLGYRLSDWLRRHGEWCCGTCEKPISGLHDIYEVESL